MRTVEKVRKSMKQLIEATKKLKTSRTEDVFIEADFTYSFESITYGKQIQQGDFTISYLVSPNPSTSNTAPSLTYGDVIEVFEANMGSVFKTNNLVLISYSYGQSDVITDATTGSVSLGFTINIRAIDNDSIKD